MLVKRRSRFCPHGHDTEVTGTRKDNSCSECRRQRNKKIYRRDTIKIRKRQMVYHRKILYGISEIEYKHLMSKFGNKCAICLSEPNKKALSIDHNHKTGKIRGLLCQPCNFILGHAQDNVDRLMAAISYLKNNYE